MRVGAYIDGLNLYYGGRHLCGRGTPGWRWLDIAKLVEHLVSRNPAWTAQQATVHRIAYCTAVISGQADALNRQRQQTYLAALMDDPRTKIEEGNFITRRIRGADIASGTLHTVEVPEEKGSDENVASHLLIDLHTDEIDAAVLITNDSDLRLPAQHTPTACATRNRQSQRQADRTSPSGTTKRRSRRALVVLPHRERLPLMPAPRGSRRSPETDGLVADPLEKPPSKCAVIDRVATGIMLTPTRCSPRESMLA